MIIRISMLLGAFLLAGCSTFPEKIQVEDKSVLVSYEDASSKAEQVKGKMLRWGGAIAKIENKADSTLLEIVHFPLTSYGKPIAGDESMGRFRINVNGFMDPMIYQEGRLMTFTGQFNGLEDGLVGEQKYVFPVVQSEAYYLWKDVQNINVTGIHLWHQNYWYGHYPRSYNRRLYIGGSNYSRTHKTRATRSKTVKTKSK